MQVQLNISEEAKDLVCTLVRIDPNHRPTAREALDHKWFTKKFGHKEAVKLGSAQKNLEKRRLLKQSNHDDFIKQEGVSMSQLTKELLRYGLDSTPLMPRAHHSAVLDAKDLSFL